MNAHLKRRLLALSGILLIAGLCGILTGSVNIPLGQLLLKENQPIIALRALRILVAVIAGSGLACSGIVLQAILRNPLAEPYLLGTSSGAGLSAVIAIIIGASGLYLPLAAFIGAISSMILVYNLARQGNKVPEQSLILSGVIVSVALSAIMVFLISISSSEVLHSITWWLWGNLQVYDVGLLVITGIIVFFGIAAIYVFSQDLNAITLGEEEAIHLGIDVEATKKILILITSVVISSVVCVCGIIGFVGLMVPHMMRLVVGPNHRVLIPATCLSAAVFMVACDILSRVIFPPLEIPIGVITAILGAPTFMFLLKRGARAK